MCVRDSSQRWPAVEEQGNGKGRQEQGNGKGRQYQVRREYKEDCIAGTKDKNG